MIGRLLKNEEVVHHKDGNINNYSADNLIIFIDQANHARYHQTGILVETSEPYVYYSPKQYADSCVVCGKSIKNTKHDKCRTCLAMERRKVMRPPKSILAELIQTDSFCAIGRKYGVSDNAVRKWCKSYGIDYSKMC